MHIGDRKPKVYLYGRNRVARIVILVSFCVQIAKCRVLENFQGLKVRGRGRGQGLLNWSSRILEDEHFPRGQQLCLSVTALKAVYIHIWQIISSKRGSSVTWYLQRGAQNWRHNDLGHDAQYPPAHFHLHSVVPHSDDLHRMQLRRFLIFLSILKIYEHVIKDKDKD